FQDAVSSFHPKRSIEASIREALRSLCGRDAKLDQEELSKMVGLTPDLMKRRPPELSGGQCQRFAIARAVAPKPEILLCDEITSALDVSTQAQILRLVSRICEETGTSAIFVSHDLAVVSCLCDRILVMKDGAVVEEGDAKQIIENPKEEYTKKLIESVMEIK
ncbi:MAG: ATP-binding cassette domain-containing protein, partial [Lachnospiraceae bacterium]|nr:ATP-binding cassette domain-containing protein [Lachnospiraceae bacterium]